MRIGVDFGGTKIEAVALDADGSVLARRRVATPANDYQGTLKAIAGLIHDLEHEVGRRGSVGVGIPGAFSRATGLVKNANSVWITGQPFEDDLADALGRPVRVDNDANCLALSEAMDGAAAGAGVVFAVILGTGVGGGIVVDGHVLKGLNAIAGEWGHNPLPSPEESERPGPPCYCGKRGCIETFLSGPGFARDYREAGGDALKPAEIVARADAGEALAEAALALYEERLARALAGVINILDPDVVVLAGGMSNVDRVYERVPVLWGAYVFSDRVDTRLVRAKFGPSSGVRGAAWLWPEAAVP